MSILSAIRDWPWRRITARILFGVAVLVTIVALFYAEERWRWRRAWLQYAADAQSRGVPLEPNNGPERDIPDELNAAKAKYFTSQLDPHAERVLETLKGTRFTNSNESMRAAKAALIAQGLLSEDGLVAARTMDRLFEREFADPIRSLTSATNRPFFQSPLSNLDGIEFRQSPNLLDAFELSAMYAEVLIANGKRESAREALSTMFRLGNLVDKSRTS